jgi:hypothetical protein
MYEASRYRARAAECLEAAEQATDERKRVVLVAMAQSWIRLAEQAVRNSQTDVVYETPPSRPPDRHLQ